MKHEFKQSELIEMGLTSHQLANFRKFGMISGRQVNGQWTYTRSEVENILKHSPAALVSIGSGNTNVHKPKRFRPAAAVQRFVDKVKTAITPTPRATKKTAGELATAWNIPTDVVARAGTMAGIVPTDGSYTPDQVAALDRLLNGASNHHPASSTPSAPPADLAPAAERLAALEARIDQLSGELAKAAAKNRQLNQQLQKISTQSKKH